MLEMNKEITPQALTGAASHNEVGMFLVFAFDTYYPAGGFNDFIGMALSLNQARAMVADHGTVLGGYQIVDYKRMEVVETKRLAGRTDMRSQFGNVVYISVDGNEGVVCGFAPSCKELILLVFPSINRKVLDREDFKIMIDEVDNVTGALYVMKPKVGNPLIMNSTLEGLQKEYDEWLDRTSQQQSSQ